MPPEGTVAPAKPGSPLEATPVPGTPALAPAGASGTGTDAELEARFDAWKLEVQEENQRNVSRLTSKLQSQHATDLAARDATIKGLRESTHKAQLAAIPEDERASYERNYYAQENAELAALNERLQAEVGMASEMGNLAEYYVKLGVPIGKLDFTGIDQLSQSGAIEVVNVINGLQERLQGLQSASPGPMAPLASPPAGPPPAAPPKAPPVLPGTIGVVASGVVTLEEIRKSISDSLGRPVDMEEIYRMAEKNPRGTTAQRLQEYLTAREAGTQGQ